MRKFNPKSKMIHLPLALIDIVSLFGVVGSLIAALSSALFSRLARRAKEPKVVMAANESHPRLSEHERHENDARLSEARVELQRQESAARWSGRSAAALAISQYVVGGTLATAFVQNALPEQAVGFLGLVVLLASIIYQRFRPDLRTSSARRRVAALKAIIRKAEDGFYAIREKLPHAPTIQAIRIEVTNVLIQVEHSELEDNFLPFPSPIRQDEPKDQ